MATNNIKSHGSSFGKSIVWRILGVLTLGTLTYLFTRSWITTTAVTMIHHGIFLFVFYLNERLWMRIKSLKGRRRYIVKALFYECVLGFYIGGAVAVILTGQWKALTYITGIYTVIRIITFFFYDQIWKEPKK